MVVDDEGYILGGGRWWWVVGRCVLARDVRWWMGVVGGCEWWWVVVGGCAWWHSLV